MVSGKCWVKSQVCSAYLAAIIHCVTNDVIYTTPINRWHANNGVARAMVALITYQLVVSCVAR